MYHQRKNCRHDHSFLCFYVNRITELADLGDRKWLGGLDGENDTGAFLVTVEYCEDTAKFNLMVYNWSDHVP